MFAVSHYDPLPGVSVDLPALVWNAASYSVTCQVYYDPFQFANVEFLLKTTLPAALAVVSW